TLPPHPRTAPAARDPRSAAACGAAARRSQGGLPRARATARATPRAAREPPQAARSEPKASEDQRSGRARTPPAPRRRRPRRCRSGGRRGPRGSRAGRGTARRGRGPALVLRCAWCLPRRAGAAKRYTRRGSGALDQDREVLRRSRQALADHRLILAGLVERLRLLLRFEFEEHRLAARGVALDPV